MIFFTIYLKSTWEFKLRADISYSSHSPVAAAVATLFTAVMSYGLLYLTVTVAVEYAHVRLGSAAPLQFNNDEGLLAGATDNEVQVCLICL